LVGARVSGLDLTSEGGSPVPDRYEEQASRGDKGKLPRVSGLELAGGRRTDVLDLDNTGDGASTFTVTGFFLILTGDSLQSCPQLICLVQLEIDVPYFIQRLKIVVPFVLVQ
jgi:hypothetical protein